MWCSVLTGTNSSVMEAWLWNLLNVGVVLVGYHAAAFSIDWKWWGRVRMQVYPNLTYPIHLERIDTTLVSVGTVQKVWWYMAREMAKACGAVLR